MMKNIDILTALVLYSQSDYLNYYKGFWLTYCSVLYESTEHADETVVRFGIKIYLKIESNAWVI